MSQLSLSRWLKTIVIVFGIMSAVFIFGFIPYLGIAFSKSFSHFSWAYAFYLGRIWILAVPFYIALACFWRICCNIAADRSFCVENAKMCSRISVCALIDSVLCFLLMLFSGIFHLLRTGYLLASVLLTLGGLAVAVAAALLSHLIEKAVRLQEENELTI